MAREIERVRADSGLEQKDPYRLSGIPDRAMSENLYRLPGEPARRMPDRSSNERVLRVVNTTEDDSGPQEDRPPTRRQLRVINTTEEDFEPEQERPGTRRGLRVVNNTQAGSEPEQARRSDGYCSINASEPPNESIALRYMDADALARLEGRDCFSSEPAFAEEELNWARFDFADHIVHVPPSTSKFSDDSDSATARPGGLFRSLSNNFKGSLRRPSTSRGRSISRPTEFRDLDPRSASSDVREPHPERKAIPIEVTQKRSIAALGNQQAAEDRYPFALRPKPSVSKRPPYPQRRLAPPPPPPMAQPRRIKIVGLSDRMTQFGDFIDNAYSDADDDNPPESLTHEEYTTEERTILDITPLSPLRPNHGRAKYGSAQTRDEIVRHQCATFRLPTPVKVTSQHDWRMSEEFPTVRDLFDEIDNHIADSSDIPHEEKPRVNQEAHRLKGILDREDQEMETVVDTFIRPGHTSWRVTERPDERTVRSEYQRLERKPVPEKR